MSILPQTASSGSLISRLWVTATFCAVALLLIFPVFDPDTFWHIANGRAMIEQGRIIQEEIFSYTAAGKQFNNHEWLSQIVMFLAYRAGGAAGLTAFKVAITLTACLLVFRTARLMGASPVMSALLCYLQVAGALIRYVERPQLFSFLGLALLGLLLYGFQKGRFSPRIFYGLPVIMVLWDCFHGAVYGLLFLLTFTGSEIVKPFLSRRFPDWEGVRPLSPAQIRSLVTWSVITIACMVINPFGLRHYDVFLNLVNRQTEAQFVREFMPLPFTLNFLHFWVLLAVTGLPLIRSPKRTDLTLILVYLCFGLMLIKYVRAIEAFTIVMVPILAHFAGRLENLLRERGKAVACSATLGCAVVAVLAGTILYKFQFTNRGQDPLRKIDNHAFRIGFNEKYFPAGAVNFIKESGLSGNMYNSDRFGGYLSYFLTPERKIFQYNHPTIFTHYLMFLENSDYRKIFNISYALIKNRTEENIFREFVPVYREPGGVQILVKDSPGNRAVIDKYRIRHFNPDLSNEELMYLAGNPRIYPEICREIAHYLSFRSDRRISNLMALLMRRPNDLLSQDERLRLVSLARRGNSTEPELLTTEGTLLYTVKKDLPSAKAAFLAALKDNGNMPAARLNLAYIELDLGNAGESERHFREILKDASGNADALYGLGLACYQQGNFREALKRWETYLKENPDSEWNSRIRDLAARIPPHAAR